MRIKSYLLLNINSCQNDLRKLIGSLAFDWRKEMLSRKCERIPESIHFSEVVWLLGASSNHLDNDGKACALVLLCNRWDQ